MYLFVIFYDSFHYSPFCNRICLWMIEVTSTHPSSMRHSRKCSRQSMSRRERCSICTALLRTGTDCSGLSWWRKQVLCDVCLQVCSLQDLKPRKTRSIPVGPEWDKAVFSWTVSYLLCENRIWQNTLQAQVHSAHQFLCIVRSARQGDSHAFGTFRNLHIHRVWIQPLNMDRFHRVICRSRGSIECRSGPI